jgi:hypothetical protein
MNINHFERQRLLKRFPNVELSYEKNVYKKVHNSHLYLAGIEKNKCFAWFTYFKNNNVCIILKLCDDKISSVDIYPCVFNKKLSYGTILYGNHLTIDKLSYFYIEDILQFMGKNIDKQTWENRLNYLNLFFENTTQVAYTNKYIVFSPPIMSDKYNDVELYVNTSPFTIDYIQSRNIDDDTFYNFSFKNIKRYEKKYAIFIVKPEIKSDTYSLYTNEFGKEQFYNIACIPDYKTSVMMNSLFRIIKENKNLDALEESDDEDEFENINEDKFVFLNKKYNMRCEYSYRFKKWIPIEITNEKVFSSKNLE